MPKRLNLTVFAGLLAVIACLLPVAAQDIVVPDEAQKRDFEAAELAYQAGDYAAAVDLFLPLAEANNPDAQYYVGFLYEQGLGVDHDNAKAAAWYKRAAFQGHTEAQNHLGLLYYEGRGVVRDFKRAFIFFELAAAEGNQDAANNRLIVARKMTTDQITEAQKLAGKMLGDLRNAVGGALPMRLASGVVITAQGHVLTHMLAVKNCTEMTIRVKDESRPATVSFVDGFNGLAVLQMADPAAAAVAFRGVEITPGAAVNVAGYRYNDEFAIVTRLTESSVAEVPGMDRLDNRYVPLATRLEPTMLGAPVIDGAGALVAVVETGVEPESVAMIHGAVPEDMSFAVRQTTVQPLLQMHGITVRVGTDGAPLARDAFDALLEEVVVAVECWRGAI